MPSEEALKLATLINRVAGIIADIGVFPTANYATFAAFVEAVRTRLIDIETDTGAITWGDITGIVNDLGVFPTTNYATFAAFVEDVRTRLIAIPTVMVGTDGAALVASGWDAALATILDNFSAARIAYLDHLIAADTAGTHDITTANDQVETDMLEIAKTTMYAVSIYIDVQTLIDAAEGGTVTFRMYNKIDESTYRIVSEAEFVVGTDTTHPSFEAQMINHNVKVTVQCSTDVTVTRQLKYRYIVRDLE